MNSASERPPGSPISSSRRSPHLRQVTSTRSAWPLPLLADGAVLDALGGSEEGVVRTLGEDADRDGLRHAFPFLHQEGRADEAALAARRVLELVVPVVEAEVAGERREVDGALLAVELPLDLGVGLPADDALGDLRRLGGGAGVQDVGAVDARDELGVVF